MSPRMWRWPAHSVMRSTRWEPTPGAANCTLVHTTELFPCAGIARYTAEAEPASSSTISSASLCPPVTRLVIGVFRKSCRFTALVSPGFPPCKG